MVVSMARKAASISARVPPNLVRKPGQTRRSARTADRRRAAHAARGHGDQLVDRGRSAAPAGPNATNNAARQVTDDFPKSVAVLDRELDAIETYLGACLNEMLGGTD